jgi:ubiquinone/menaquinone biosynthesis C-methylase UbiE
MTAAPSTSNIGVLEKAREWYGYFRKHRSEGQDGVSAYLANLDEYRGLMQARCGRDVRGAEVLEIGFGTRASRLAMLSAAGALPIGVDLEVPMLDLKPSTMRRIQQQNGFERLAKSVARYLLFDRSARNELQRALEREFSTSDLDYGQLEVCDVGDLELPGQSLDLIVSEDVFEHMTVDSLSRTIERMRIWLKPGAIALVRPNVFTGISGGHLAEWGVASVRDHPEQPRRSEPWEHLRGRRFSANTHLNELTRAEYRQHFRSGGFEILEESCRYPDLGASLLTPAVREELSQWPDEELFSNQTLFVLRPV